MFDKKIGLIAYFIVLFVLFQWQLGSLFRPLPILSILLGVWILTMTQWKKGTSKEELLEMVMKNGFFAGIISTLLSLLANITNGIELIADSVLPAIYGGLWYTLLKFILSHEQEQEKETEQSIASGDSQVNLNWNTPEFIQPILIQQGFSTRECHVGLKIIQGSSNKEIAEQLYISEATVKKHIQNIYKRCGVNDRRSFMIWFLETADIGDKRNPQ